MTDGAVHEVDEPDVTGEIALRPGWPSMFRGYLHDDERYAACFAGGWYLTGDAAHRDADGWFWFDGRADDVIKSAGHLIGPVEVERALLDHPAVVEAGVIGVPDDVAGEVVQAYVSLRPGIAETEELRSELLGHPRKHLGPAVAPRSIVFDAHLPKTKSGKIMRRLLRARALGSPRGRPLDARGRPVTGTMETAPGLDREEGRALLRDLLRIRRFEERCVELYSAGLIHGFLHLSIGEEAVAVGLNRALDADDAVVGTYREHGHALARGIPATVIMAEMYGKVSGTCRGRGGSMHIFDRDHRLYGGNAIVGGGLPLAVGLALADRMRGQRTVTACVFGEGAVAEGEFHESMNLAALWQLPVLFVCENNLYAMGTALDRSESETDMVRKASSYAMPAWSVDGMDVLAVANAAQQAVLQIRAGGGPVFLEMRTYRFRAHSMYDPERYRTKEEVEEWKHRDPIVSLTARLREGDTLDDRDIEAIEAEVTAEIDAAADFADAADEEPVDELLRFVHSEVTP